MALGLFLNIFLFLFLGDVWELNVLKLVMGFGLIFSFISLIMMFFFSDQKSLGTGSDSITIDNNLNGELTLVNESSNSSLNKDLDSNSKTELKTELKTKLKTKLKFIPVRYIPFILVGCNIIIGLGAGMTVKFFIFSSWKSI